MKQIWKFCLPAILIAFTAFATLGVEFQSVSALTLEQGAEAARCDGCPTNLFGNDGVFKQITNTVLYIVGIIAVIMLIIGGVKYLVSGGDSKKVTDAKNTVLYAIIGLIIALLSYAIVNFVVSALPSGPSNTDSTSESNNSGTVNNSSSNSSSTVNNSSSTKTVTPKPGNSIYGSDTSSSTGSGTTGGYGGGGTTDNTTTTITDTGTGSSTVTVDENQN